MNQMYHYATVSKALDELNENGFTYDFNLMNRILQKQKYMRLNTFTAMKEILILDEAVVYGINPIKEKGSLSQVLLQILLVMRHKYLLISV
jgi:hypothetical protein